MARVAAVGWEEAAANVAREADTFPWTAVLVIQLLALKGHLAVLAVVLAFLPF